jgi:transcriptional regulator of acetoin/glycerol metabolism
VSAFSNAVRTPFGTILPWGEVKGRAIVDALDRCGGNYLFAARLLGIGRSTVYRIARTYTISRRGYRRNG